MVHFALSASLWVLAFVFFGCSSVKAGMQKFDSDFPGFGHSLPGYDHNLRDPGFDDAPADIDAPAVCSPVSCPGPGDSSDDSFSFKFGGIKSGPPSSAFHEVFDNGSATANSQGAHVFQPVVSTAVHDQSVIFAALTLVLHLNMLQRQLQVWLVLR